MGRHLYSRLVFTSSLFGDIIRTFRDSVSPLGEEGLSIS